MYTRTTAYRHESIPDAVAALRTRDDIEVVHTEDPASLETGFDAFEAVVFLSTSGDVLTPAGRTQLSRYVESGGGFVGVHAAACTEYVWPYYGQLLGARFARHPDYQQGVVLIEDAQHPATRHLPRAWTFDDEWYDFQDSPRAATHVLAVADETSYQGGGMGADHPIVWCRQQGKGRVFYTALGHSSRAWEDPLFMEHVAGGIFWAAGRTD
ncbi:ThuA domain-containing protein [Streptomyces sp. NPDC056708]|uniref:ThuA domain-containing protein n=1 Tax=unclassified Streptomyces TaxID=2593676 RepID=UPI00369A48A8